MDAPGYFAEYLRSITGGGETSLSAQPKNRITSVGLIARPHVIE